MASPDYDELVRQADLDGGNCVHDAMLGMSTYECPRCMARRALWAIQKGDGRA